MPWTTLNTTSQPGETTITVNKELDWEVGQEIVIAPTGYNAWETETFKITALAASDNTTIITLNDTLKFKHLGKHRSPLYFLLIPSYLFVQIILVHM